MPASLGKYYDQINAGNVFILSSAAAGAALPIVTGTAATFGLWNTSQTHNAVLMKINIGFTSGTIALGEFGLAALNTPVYAAATGAAVTAVTPAVLGATLRNAKVGSGKSTVMTPFPATCTIAASTSFPYYWLGGSMTSATGAQPATVLTFDLDGLVVPPGQLVHLAGSVAQTGLYTSSLMWAEVPI